MKPSALFLSPHLDDVAFSCGGTLISLIEDGWRVCLCTLYTASVQNPQGFALACQLDKNLPAEVDYMALRRDEDRAFAAHARVPDLLHLGFPEAPHRGYFSPADLFAGMHEEDAIWRELAVTLRKLAAEFRIVFAPQGLGNHVDHLQTIQAVREADLADRIIWYQDTPYAIRDPAAQASALLPSGLSPLHMAIDPWRKVEACRAYVTQVPFQFGSDALMQAKLETFHRVPGGYTEIMLAGDNPGQYASSHSKNFSRPC